MPTLVRDCCTGRLGRIIIGLLILYGAGVLVLKPGHLILLLNGLALSVAAGVSTAFLPIAGQAVRRLTPTRGDVLGAGIFFAGLSDVATRLQSLAARDFAWPGIFNTDFAALSIFLGLMSLVAFLWAPYAEDGDVPREKWGLAGLIVAAGVAIAFAAGIAHHTMLPAPAFQFQ